MHRQIPAPSAPRRNSYSCSFASIRGFNLLAPPTAPRSPFRPVVAWFPDHATLSTDGLPFAFFAFFAVGYPCLQTQNPRPQTLFSEPEPRTRNPLILNDLPKFDPEKKRSKPAPKRSKKVTKRAKYGPKTSKRPLNWSPIRPKRWRGPPIVAGVREKHNFEISDVTS
jgi:hypothetical protein